MVNCNTDKWVTSISHYAALLEITAGKSNKIYVVFFTPSRHFFCLLFLPHLHSHSDYRWMLMCFSCMQFNCRRGATVHFSCDEGYELQGSKGITCLRVTDSYVGWSDDRPICRGKYVGCPPICTCVMEVVPMWPPFISSYSGALMLMCWLVSALSFYVDAQSIFFCSLCYWFSVHHFIVTGLTLTFGQHSCASSCLAMLA